MPALSHCTFATVIMIVKVVCHKTLSRQFKKKKVPLLTRCRSDQSFPLAGPLTGGSAPCWRSPRCLRSAELPGFARLECWTPPRCAPGAAGLVW